MPKLSEKIKTALDEARILVLGCQVLIGMQMRAAFEPGFERLSTVAQVVLVVGYLLLVACFVLICTPSAYHRIVEKGEDSPRLHRVIGAVMAVALLPFAAGLGLDVGVALSTIAPPWASVGAGALASAVALTFWYGLEAAARDRRKEADLSDGGKTELSQKIVQVLTEARVVLPGAQAVAGFQFVIMLMNRFAALPAVTKWVHVASLCCTALAVVLLMTPAAYHRLVERGEDSEQFHTVASRLVLAAMVPLALGLCGDTYVVIRAALEHELPAIIIAAALAVVFFAFWFGWTLYTRESRRPHAQRTQPA